MNDHTHNPWQLPDAPPAGSRRADVLDVEAALPEPDPLLDIIWNTTAICGWNCADCCVSATHVKRIGDKVAISSPDLSTYVEIKRDRSQGSIFDQALRYRQITGRELTLEQKVAVLDHLQGHRVRVDISGGDALSPREGYTLLDAASSRVGKENVTLTATGAGLANYDIASIQDLIGELNFTYDGEPDPDNQLRPSAYASGNLRRARMFADVGVPVRAECPLNVQNAEPAVLSRIYRDLHDAGVSKLLVMRLFPSGRGALRPEDIPSIAQYQTAIALLRQLEARYGFPVVKLQCALRHIEGPTGKNPCDAGTESFGLMWDGTLLGSPWAIDRSGKPIDEAWVLGNLVDNTLTHVLESDKVKRLRARAHENSGHCKFFAWTAGSSASSEDRIFESSDPLYIRSSAVSA